MDFVDFVFFLIDFGDVHNELQIYIFSVNYGANAVEILRDVLTKGVSLGFLI